MPTLAPPVTPYYGGGQVKNPADVIQSTSAPNTADTKHNIGTLYVNTSNRNSYILTSLSGGTAGWSLFSGSSGSLLALDGDTGTAVPTAGVITIAGTALEIETSAASSTVTIGIPATFSIGSSAAANSATILSGTGGITLTATNGAIAINSGTGALGISTDAAATAVSIASGAGAKTLIVGSTDTTSTSTLQSGSGGIALNSATGNGAISLTSGTGAINISDDATAATLSIGTGAGAKTVNIGSTNTTSATNLTAGSGGVNCATNFALTSAATQISMIGGAVTDFIGSALLSGGTATVANTNIAANDVILLSRSTTGGTEGTLSYTISAGASFTITSTSGTDTSTIAYVIFRQN